MNKKTSVVLAVVTMVLVGIADILMKKVLDLGLNFISLSFYLYVILLVLMGGYCLLKGYPLKPNKDIIFYALMFGFLLCGGTALSLMALKDGNASVVIPIVRLGFVFTAVCAFLFLKERLTVQKGLGLFFAVVSLVLLSI